MARPRKISLADAAKAVTLVEDLGYSQTAASNVTGLGLSTVSDILAPRYRWGEIVDGPVFLELRRQQKKAFQAALFDLTRQSLIQAQKELPNASYYQAVTGAAILMDKERLYAGEPTEITANLNVNAGSLEELASALAKCISPESNDISPNQTKKS
jgi:hypothetical protein